MKRILFMPLVAVLMVAGEPALAAIADLLPAPATGAASVLSRSIDWLTSGADAGMILPDPSGR